MHSQGLLASIPFNDCGLDAASSKMVVLIFQTPAASAVHHPGTHGESTDCLVKGSGTVGKHDVLMVSQVGGSPLYTMTEDYALGMELKKEGLHSRYVREYLALG